MYPSLADSDFHRPCLLNSLSGTPLLAAAVAPPALKLCNPYCSAGNPRALSFSLKHSRNLL